MKLSALKGVILDRDGVLNELVYDPLPRAPRSISEVAYSVDAMEGVEFLQKAGLSISVVTNQPDVARGVCSFSDVMAVQDFILNNFRIEFGFVCVHSDGECDCRKPATAGIEAVLNHFDFRGDDVAVIGDRWTDILAAVRVGAFPVLLSNNLERSYEKTSSGAQCPEGLQPGIVFSSWRDLISNL